MTDNQASGTKSFYSPLQAQESTLLSIPSEVRNGIFDAICESSQTVTVYRPSKHRIEPIEHPLARMCRQLREEFLPVWTERATDHVTTVVCVRDWRPRATHRVDGGSHSASGQCDALLRPEIPH